MRETVCRKLMEIMYGLRHCTPPLSYRTRGSYYDDFVTQVRSSCCQGQRNYYVSPVDDTFRNAFGFTAVCAVRVFLNCGSFVQMLRICTINYHHLDLSISLTRSDPRVYTCTQQGYPEGLSLFTTRFSVLSLTCYPPSAYF